MTLRGLGRLGMTGLEKTFKNTSNPSITSMRAITLI